MSKPPDEGYGEGYTVWWRSDGRRVPPHPDADHADMDYERARLQHGYYTGAAYFLSHRRKPARKP